jgi:hypothetical protein
MLKRWESTFAELQRRAIRVCIALELPHDLQRDWSDNVPPAIAAKQKELSALVAWLENFGIHVELREKIHAKLLLIDEELLWEGSLNFLSHFDASEHLRRTVSRADVQEVIQRHLLRSCQKCCMVEADWNSTLRLAVRQRRRSCILSQRELSKILGCKQSQLSRLETGQTPLLHPIFEKLLRLIGLRIVLVPEYLHSRVQQILEYLSAEPDETR